MPDRTKSKKKESAAPSAVKQTEAGRPSADGRNAAAAPRLGKVAQTRRDALHAMLMAKRQEIMDEIKDVLGQTLTEDKQRRLESAMDVGDQALADLERELGISLMEMRNRKRQLIDEALTRLQEGMYGICADCGVEISEKRLAAVPFARLCVECQSREELLEKIEKEEERD
jgi:DnaK suppressor protein